MKKKLRFKGFFKSFMILAVLCFSQIGLGQVDDFTDGNFNASPVWAGNETSFSVLTNATLPGGLASTDESFLASNAGSGVLNVALTIPSTITNEWKFSLGSPTFNPANTNYFGVILMSNVAVSGSITGVSWNGYYIRIGVDGSADKIELWKKNGTGAGTKVGDFPSSPTVATGALQNGMNFRITRGSTGVFELFYSTGFTYSATPTVSAGTLTDNAFTTSSYFGVYQMFTNAGATRRVYIDNVVLGTNTVPVASNVLISGSTEVGETLVGTYDYDDVENDQEATSIYKWYRADNATGLNEVAIAGATSSSYTLTIDDLNKFIKFSVVPVATAGTLTGVETFSDYNGPITSSNNLQSTITTNSAFIPASNIDYTSFTGNDVTSISLEVARLDINDVAGSSDDGLSTLLNAIEFSVSNFDNLDKIAIYDGSTELQEVSSASSISFTGLSLEALSNSSKTFSLRATFKTTVTDNQQIQFTVSSATADISGSLFSSNNAGGASSSINADENRIEVTATSLLFTQDPSNVAINAVMSPAPIVQAYDNNLNLDLDFNSAVELSLSGSAFASSATISVNAVNGVATFSNLVFDNPATGITIEGASVGLTSTGNSTTFNVQIPPAGLLLLEENFNFTGALTANGFSDHSGGITPVINAIANNGLIYPNYAGSGIGNAAFLNGAGQDVNRTFTEQSSDFTIYCSSLVNVSTATSNGDYFLNFGPTLIGTTFRGRISVRSNGSNISFGVSNDGGVTNYTPFDFNLNETYLLVLKLNFDGTNTISSLFINPSVFSEPSAPNITDSDATTITNIGSIAIRQGSAAGAATLTIDEIRVGTGWGAVLGNPIYDSNATINAGTYNDVTILNNTLETNGVVKIYNKLNVDGGTFNTNDNLILASTSSNTAQVTPVSGNVIGNVTIERYIPAKRAWRALTAPLRGSNGSLYATWQNGGSTIADTGLEMWGPSGTNLATGPNYSVLNYTPTGWVGVSNTSTTNLFDSTDNNAYLLFVTGAYGNGNVASGASATTLKATGELITGNLNYTIDNTVNTRHTLIGNPYASPLNPSQILDGSTNLVSKFWLWDPALATTGAYVSYDDVLETYSNTIGSYPTSGTNVQSGQAIFVIATTGNSGILTLTENKKATGVSNVFGKNANQNFDNSNTASILRFGLFKESNQEWKPLDGAIAGFYDTANAAVDNNDGKKLANGAENIAFVRNNITLSSEHFSNPQPLDEMYIRVWNTSVNNYKLRINTESFTVPNIEATLVDLFTGIQTPITLDGSVQEYVFAVTSAVASTGDRFKVVFSTSALSTTTIDSKSINVYPNPVTNGIVNIQLPIGDYTNYSYELVNVLGQKVMSDTIGTLSGNEFSFNAKGLANNWYALRILNSGKVVYQTKVIIAN